MTEHEQEVQRVTRAIMHLARDAGASRKVWLAIYFEQADAWLREVITELAVAERDDAAARLARWRRLRKWLTANAPTQTRRAFLSKRHGGRVEPWGQERTVDEDITNRDFARENTLALRMGHVDPRYGSCVIAHGTNPRFATGERWNARKRKHETLWSPIWTEDIDLRFNNLGSLGYADSFSDAMTESEMQERRALRHGTLEVYRVNADGLVHVYGQDDLYTADVHDDDHDEPVDEREDTERDGNEVVTQEEDVSAQDYAPAVTRKEHTHEHPVIVRDRPLVTENVLYLPTDRSFDQNEANLAFQAYLDEHGADEPAVQAWDDCKGSHLDYALMSEAMRLRPWPHIHPGQEMPREREEAPLRRGLAPDGTAWNTRVLDYVADSEKGLRFSGHFTRMAPYPAPRFYDTPHIPVELQPRTLSYTEPRPRPHSSLERVTVTAAMQAEALRSFWLPGMHSDHGRALMAAKLADLEAQMSSSARIGSSP